VGTQPFGFLRYMTSILSWHSFSHPLPLLIGAVLYKLLFARTIKLPEEEKIKNTMLIGLA